MREFVSLLRLKCFHFFEGHWHQVCRNKNLRDAVCENLQTVWLFPSDTNVSFCVKMCICVCVNGMMQKMRQVYGRVNNLFFIKESIWVEWWSSVDSFYLWIMLDIHCFACKFENFFRYQSFLSDWNANYTVSWENKKRHIRNGNSVNTFVRILEGVFSQYSSRC